MSEPTSESALPRSSIVILTGVLMLFYMVIRLPGAMAMPIFGDEAIYIRWADLLRQGYPWVCLIDPKPPLHFWLMALPLGWVSDPLVAARGLSIVAGLLTIPAAMALCTEIEHLFYEPAQVAGRNSLPVPGGRSLGLIFTMFLIFCPFLAFYQRMALADALFVLEMLVAIWVSLRWARNIAAGGSGRSTAVNTILLGLAMAAAMLTRQGVSYVLWGMPVAVLALHGGKAGGWRRCMRGLLPLGAAVGLALTLWSPYLVVNLDKSVAEAREEWVLAYPREPVPSDGALRFGEIKRRILYQEHFTETGNRGALMLRNIRLTFGWGWRMPTAPGQAEPGWFWLYLTPGVYGAGLLGLVWLAVRRQWRVLVFVGVWLMLMLGPIVVMSAVLRSRYTLAGAIPLLLSAAYLVVDLLGVIFTKRIPDFIRWIIFAVLLSLAGVLLIDMIFDIKHAHREGLHLALEAAFIAVDLLAMILVLRIAGSVRWIIAGVLLAGLGILPIREINLQNHDWRDQTLTAEDRYQYITGWTAGLATDRTIQFIRRMAEDMPLVVITNNDWGTPADALWVYLSRVPNVRLYYISWQGRRPILQPAGEGKYLLRGDKWLYTPAEPVALERDVPVLFVTPDPISGAEAEEYLRQFNPNLPPGIPFYGVEESPRSDHVTMFHIQ